MSAKKQACVKIEAIIQPFLLLIDQTKTLAEISKEQRTDISEEKPQ